MYIQPNNGGEEYMWSQNLGCLGFSVFRRHLEVPYKRPKHGFSRCFTRPLPRNHSSQIEFMVFCMWACNWPQRRWEIQHLSQESHYFLWLYLQILDFNGQTWNCAAFICFYIILDIPTPLGLDETKQTAAPAYQHMTHDRHCQQNARPWLSHVFTYGPAFKTRNI